MRQNRYNTYGAAWHMLHLISKKKKKKKGKCLLSAGTALPIESGTELTFSR